MKYLIIIVTLISFANCKGDQKSEEKTESQQTKQDEDKPIAIAAEEVDNDEYYVFTDGGKWKKADWVNDKNISTFSQVLQNDVGIEDALDCLLSDLASKHPLSKVKPLLIETQEEDYDDYLALFNELEVMSILNSCLGNNGNEGTALNIDWENAIDEFGSKETFKKSIKAILKLQFESDPEMAEYMKLVDEDGFYDCITEIILNKNLTNESALTYFSSEEYSQDIGKCFSDNILE